MDIQPTNQQPISDDQELAKVLAGVNQQAEAVAAEPVAEDTPANVQTLPDTMDPQAMSPAAVQGSTQPIVQDSIMQEPTMQTSSTIPTMGGGDLESIKKNALSELRPLVDKLDVAPEEKFDTYLLLLRSTDDKALIGPAHEAARSIIDETRRAQALLDVIKEIDYLSGPQQPAM